MATEMDDHRLSTDEAAAQRRAERLRVTSAVHAEHYKWGANSDGWHLVRSDGLSVIEEKMPPGDSEVRHYHAHSRQFFYVLAGCATIECDGRDFALLLREGLEMPPGVPHKVCNRGTETLRVLVISQPPSHGDVSLPHTIRPSHRP